MSETATPEGTPVETPVVTDKPLEPTPKMFDESYVKELRSENAGLRVKSKEAVDAAVAEVKAAHAAELIARDNRITELENELGQSWVELEKVNVSLDARVPSDKVRAFTEILQGSDKDSLVESAKKNLELFGGFETRSPAFDPTQGFGGRPADLPLNGDPILDALKKVIGV